MEKRYPGGKKKAFNITYDDGILQDVRFVELLNRYGIKGTFNLNSQLMEEEFAWTHPNGMEVRRLSPRQARHLYDGHEVASHSLTHPYMDHLPPEELYRQLKTDKENLERLFGRALGRLWQAQVWAPRQLWGERHADGRPSWVWARLPARTRATVRDRHSPATRCPASWRDSPRP